MAKLLVEEPDALMRARPDLWEPWRATARATRPEAAKFIVRTGIGRNTDARKHVCEDASVFSTDAGYVSG